MNFTSPIFLFVFLPVTAAGYYLVRNELRNAFLLAASLLFYAWGEPRMVLLLAASVAVNYAAALGIEIAKKMEPGGAAIPVSALEFWNPVLLQVPRFCGAEYQLHSRDVDSRPGNCAAAGDFFFHLSGGFLLRGRLLGRRPGAKKPDADRAVYCVFPQVSMGPIAEYETFEKQLGKRSVSVEGLAAGCRRAIVGLAKKVILADQLGIVVDAIFEMPDAERTVLAAWLGILGYLFQLYFDFSGYTDMAIGIGGLFGFQTPENFNFPYLSKSVVEFWAKWHITLGDWLKKYLYTPVFRAVTGKPLPILKRKIAVQYADYIALFAVWLFAGIWHGAAWHYVAYGLYYCFFIICERVWAQYWKKRRKRLGLKKRPETRLHAAAAHLYFLTVLLFGQLLFRIRDCGAYFPYVQSMFGLSGNLWTDALSAFLLRDSFVLLLIAAAAATPGPGRVVKRFQAKREALAETVGDAAALVLLLVCLGYVETGSYNPFLYFNF